MKILITILALIACVNYGYSQGDSVYRYVYTFSNKTKSKCLYKIIASNNQSALPSIICDVTDKSGKPVKKGSVCLDYSDEILWCKHFSNGSFDTTMNPGNYELAIGKTNHVAAYVKFDIWYDSHLAINITLGSFRQVNVYKVYSQKKLTKRQIGKIKKCTTKKYSPTLCADEKDYYVTQRT